MLVADIATSSPSSGRPEFRQRSCRAALSRLHRSLSLRGPCNTQVSAFSTAAQPPAGLFSVGLQHCSISPPSGLLRNTARWNQNPRSAQPFAPHFLGARGVRIRQRVIKLRLLRASQASPRVQRHKSVPADQDAQTANGLVQPSGHPSKVQLDSRRRQRRVRHGGKPLTPGEQHQQVLQHQKLLQQQLQQQQPPFKNKPLTREEGQQHQEREALSKRGTVQAQPLIATDQQLAAGGGRSQKRMGKKRQSEAISGAAGGQAQSVPARLPGQSNKHKKSRPMTPELQVRQWVQATARDGDLGLALRAFDRLVKEGISLPPDLFGTLMYTFAGGDEWEGTARTHHARQLPSSLLFPPDMQATAPEETSAAAQEDEAAHSQSDAAPVLTNGSAAGLRDRAFHSEAAGAAPSMLSATHQQSALLAASHPTAAPHQAALPSQPLGEPALVSAEAAEGQTASAGPLNGHPGAKQEASPLQPGQPAHVHAEQCNPAAAEVALALHPLRPAERLAKGREVVALMQERNIPISEKCFTALARMAAAAGDADEALAVAQRAQSGPNATKRLRLFHPPLVAYTAAGNVEAAFKVMDLCDEARLDMGEADYALLLEAAAAGASWPQVQRVLTRMGQELTVLQAPTLRAAEAYFRSPSAANASRQDPVAQASPWQLERCTADPTGVVSLTSADQLQAVDLGPSEWTAFLEGLTSIAADRERNAQDFQRFTQWLSKRAKAPTMVIDGANVAFHAQNWRPGHFAFDQIRKVVAFLDKSGFHDDLLVVLHIGRIKRQKETNPDDAAWIDAMCQQHRLFVTPYGSNDDWYWMYAAVAAGLQGRLISNDEMRDHVFQLLAPRYFYKWKQRHQVYYAISPEGEVNLHQPVPFTTCVQQLPNGAWFLPLADSTAWMSARPASISNA
ncbi:hypothetical protein WJX74_010626 [Apatococcus lobatus]|uniref:Mitochondrial ribonuclease P catalytic subunit n=1 Tax=Apatococcus lobatus TaxID=904363 RepID=A0AAW1QN01_9CHLO